MNFNKLLISSTLVAFFFSLALVPAFGQSSSIDINAIGSSKVDDLTDEQIASIAEQMEKKQIDFIQLENMAMQKKMPKDEFNKLKNRIVKIQERNKVVDNTTNSSDNQTDASRIKQETEARKASKLFGAELFNNKALTFEPNLKIATPENYQLGPDDELLIDVYGYSEASYKLKVTPEGYIRIPLVGIIQLSGLTIEAARKKITSQLSSIYSGINTGETGVNIMLGNIRSIKVSIIGEITLPGTYTLPSLATVFNALYASGGPSQNGSFRNIKVIRGGKAIATMDVYEFILKGNAAGNIRLQDQDIIKISPYETRVELSGELKRQGIYEVKKGETLKDIITFAGGYTDMAYTKLIKVIRITGKEKKVGEIPSELFAVFTPQTGDVFMVDKIIERFENKVEIEGAVFRPGVFAIDNGLTLSQLIKKADGVKEDAFMERGLLMRIKEDNSSEMLSFNVAEVVSGKNDLKLKREDKVIISSKFDIRESYKVTINGEVLKPGEYDFSINMKVEDLILMAGGLKESADKTKIEVARKVKSVNTSNKDAETAKIFKVTLDDNLSAGGSSVVLEPFDQISVYQIPGFSKGASIQLEGEVNSPGYYAITRNNERVSDVIKRAGGLTANSYVEGAVLVRNRKLSSAEQLLRKQKLDAFLKQTRDTARAKELIDREYSESASIVGINLKKIIDNPGSKFDLVLSDGDLIRIPANLQTVRVSGEVLYPVRLRHEKGKRLKAYVSGSGGFTQRALKRRAYVVYPNGTAKATKSFLFYNFYPKVLAGSEIVVPPKEERAKLTLSEALAITSSITTLALIIITLSK